MTIFQIEEIKLIVKRNKLHLQKQNPWVDHKQNPNNQVDQVEKTGFPVARRGSCTNGKEIKVHGYNSKAVQSPPNLPSTRISSI